MLFAHKKFKFGCWRPANAIRTSNGVRFGLMEI